MTTPATTETLRFLIELPFPVSANRLWRSTGPSPWVSSRRHTGTRVYLSREYQSWIKEADALWLIQKRRIGAQMLGHYTLDLVFDEDRRRGDGDNLTKCVHDWLQALGLVKNDSLCDGGSWTWGRAPAGCLATLEGSPWSA